MATPTGSIISGENGDNPKAVDRKQSAPAAGAEARKSMLQLARKSIAQAPGASKMAKMSIRPNPTKNEANKSDNDDEGEVASSKNEELSDIQLSPPSEEQRKSLQEEAEEAKFNPFYRLHIIGFFKGVLDRLLLLMQLPEALKIADSHINLKNTPEEQKILATKKKLLATANLINYTLPHPIYLSKFEIEAKWLEDILRKAYNEMETKSTFEILNRVVEGDVAKEKKLPEAIESVKDLKWKTEVSKHLMKMEAAAHLEKQREWTQNLIKHNRELREVRKEQRIAYKYKADKLLAAGDLARRDRELKLAEARARNKQLKADIEREKLVHTAVMDYMGKQNLVLREEVLDLTANHENDTQCMTWAIEKIQNEIKMKKLQIADIEPQYEEEMKMLSDAAAEAKRKEDAWYANLGYSELSLKSAYKIQKIWRGYLVRRVWGKILKKLRKKRLKAAKKGKKK